AALAWAEDYPAGVKAGDYEHLVEYIERVWGTGRFLQALEPGVEVDDSRVRHLARVERQSMAPGTVGAIFRQQYATDARAILPVISAPALVMHVTANGFVPVEYGRYVAGHIPRARLVELPGRDHSMLNGGDAQEIMTDEIEEFVTGTRVDSDHARMLTTLVFTDVVGSTDRVVAIGDP